MLMLLAGEDAQEIVIFRKINEGIVGSNQQERREIGFREYMQVASSRPAASGNWTCMPSATAKTH